ncbi:MAG: DUF4097 domain-containing protein [Clostridiales bacterium]|nr:DUF4097 domain-containing protein [Clostridiales bacterium]
MNSFQKVIKYIAMGFAVLLTVGIVSAIVNTAIFASNIISGNIFNYNKEEGYMNFSENFTDVTNLDINIDAGVLIIKEGTTFVVEGMNVSDDFSATVGRDGTLKIKESKARKVLNNIFNWATWSNNNSKTRVIIYLPKDFVAESVRIESGACNIDIEALDTDKLIIDAGAGNIKGSQMKIDKLDLDGGVGNIIFSNVIFQDIDIDCGGGNLEIDGELYGNNQIDCGLGNVTLLINGNMDEYDLRIDAGIGDVRLNGDKVNNYNNRGKHARHKLDIDGGIGNIALKFLN